MGKHRLAQGASVGSQPTAPPPVHHLHPSIQCGEARITCAYFLHNLNRMFFLFPGPGLLHTLWLTPAQLHRAQPVGTVPSALEMKGASSQIWSSQRHRVNKIEVSSQTKPPLSHRAGHGQGFLFFFIYLFFFYQVCL